MSQATGTFATIAIELTKVLSPLEQELTSGKAVALFAELGIPITSAQVNTVSSSLNSTVTKTTDLLSLADDLSSAITAEDFVAIAQKSIAIIGKISDIVNSFSTLATAIKGLNLPGVTQAVIDNLPQRIFNYLIVTYLDNMRGINEGLQLLGILERVDQNINSIDPDNPPFTLNTFHFDKISSWFSNPAVQFGNLYDWGRAQFDGTKLFALLQNALSRISMPVIYDSVSSPVKLDLVAFEIQPETDISPIGLEIKLKNPVDPITKTINQGDWKIDTKLAFNIPSDTSLTVQPNGNITFTPFGGGGTFGGEVSATLTAAKQDASAFLLLGESGGSRFEVGQIVISSVNNIQWDGSKGTAAFKIEGSLTKCKILIDTTKGDGFLQQILPSIKLESDFDLKMGYSNQTGFYFGGSSALEINLPMHVELGPVGIDGLDISLGFDNGTIPIGLGADLHASLGPIEVAIQDIGAKAIFSFPPNNSGNLGPAQLDIGFLPPKGVGLSIDAGVVKGGGFILFDPDKGEYAGALQLSIEDTIQVSAIAIINTKMPDGSKGFSLLIIISVSFEPGISLSMGFFLSGLGGMLGINRTINVDAMRDGVKNDAIEQIMFPQDIIANINTLLPQIKSIFPIKQDQFMIGLMAKITWGVPSLVTIEFGLCIEFTNPVRLAILGVLKIVLPTEDAAILQLQVNFVGIIDFDNGYLSFDASIYNSHILTFTLEGDMALRLNWGNEKAFLMSVGGFHPSFKPPASLNVPKLKRLTLTILSPNPNLVLTAYFAVTSNTVQFGARIDFKFEAGGFSVVGYLGFDVLFQFSPFKFIADITAGLEVKMGGSTLFSINLDFELSGPTPWNANGTASFSILFFSFSVHFNVTWGDAQQVILPSIAVLPKILEAFNLDANWTAELPANRYNLVALASIVPKPGQIILQAFGAVKVSQIIMPLKLVIDKFGNNTPSDINMVDISAFRLGGLDTGLNDEAESFAPSAYKNMSDDDKLKSPSYTKEKGGVNVSDTDTLFVDYAWDRDVVYDVKVSDFDPFPQPATFNFDFKWFKLMVNGGAIGRSALSKQNSQKNFRLNNAAVNMGEEQFVLIDNSTLAQHSANVFAGGTHAQANDAFETIIKQNPSLKGKVSIASAYQLN